MPHRVLQQGIQAIQQGSADEGARLIRIALKDDALTADLRAIGYIWLAETTADRARKHQYLNSAIAADPASDAARTRLALLLSSDLPASQPVQTISAAPAAAPAPVPAASRSLNLAEHVASIIGGPRGAGTGFFVSTDGLLATTRAIVGGKDRITVDLHDGRQFTGTVVRSFPAFDLALVQVDAAPPFVMPTAPEPRVADDAPLFAFHYTGESVRGAQRPTMRVLPAHWIPTSIRQIRDAGGGPIFDERGLLVGMITRNVSQTADYLYGLHINAIRGCVEQYEKERAAGRRVYCPACGSASVAGGMGYFYCEVCGSTLPIAVNVARHPVPQAAALYEPGSIRCIHCNAASGIYQGRCLRCGQAQI